MNGYWTLEPLGAGLKRPSSYPSYSSLVSTIILLLAAILFSGSVAAQEKSADEVAWELANPLENIDLVAEPEQDFVMIITDGRS